MYILVCLILVGARLVRAIRPLSAHECLASAASIAADGVARGLADHRREIGLRLVEQASTGGAPPADVEHIRSLLSSAGHASDRLHRLQKWFARLIPNVFRSPKWVPWVGWQLVAGAVFGLFFHTLGIALGGYFFEDKDIKVHLDGKSPATIILLVAAGLTLAMALPAMIALPRTNKLWPLRFLRSAALTFTFLSALVHFATEGFAGTDHAVDRSVRTGHPVVPTRRRRREGDLHDGCQNLTQRKFACAASTILVATSASGTLESCDS
jgi:hypothetical protein